MIRFLVLLPIAFFVLLVLFFALRPDPPASDFASAPGSAADERLKVSFDLVVRGGVITPDEVEVGESGTT
jgi:hypothetical protein